LLGSYLGAKNNTKKIVILGNTEKDIESLDKTLRETTDIIETDRVGYYMEGKLFIDRTELNHDLETWKAIEALKINASLDAIVLVYPDISEVEEYGLGFDCPDLVICENVSKEVKQRLELYKEEGFVGELKVKS